MTDLARIVIVAAAVGSGLIGGVFLAFSGFVMPALRHLPDPDGIRAMQSINRSAVTAPLMITLFGTAAICVGLSVWAVRVLRVNPAAPWTLGAALIYLVSDVLVTVAANVPRNDALAAVDPTGPGAGAAWHEFVAGWTQWNHVRAAGGALAAAGFVIAAIRSAQQG